MGNVGVFWVWNGEVLASPVSLGAADQNRGFVDSPENHVDVWPRFQKQHSDLFDLEYFAIPRGRVVYNEATRRFTVYLDNALMKPGIQDELRIVFGLSESITDYERDDHYTTDLGDIERLFE
jgi:hypothetical protein